jgi:hypothetical protein
MCGPVGFEMEINPKLCLVLLVKQNVNIFRKRLEYGITEQ